MPEGPEVRRYADQLALVLVNNPIEELAARTKDAKAWLQAHPGLLVGKRITRVTAHGKNLIGYIEGGYFFYAHLMMWGSWQIKPRQVATVIDRRERARIIVADTAALLYSAPVFKVGCGDPYQVIDYLQTLGPDILPSEDQAEFNSQEFLARLLTPEHRARSIGAALLDQQIVAGIGNYLRAEILFECRIDPWRLVEQLTQAELARLVITIPVLAGRAYRSGGVTVPDELRARMQTDAALVYKLGREYGNRHYVFRRTNLPCLVCGDLVRQLRQTTYADEEGEKSRIIYFCPTCQQTEVELKKPRVKARGAGK